MRRKAFISILGVSSTAVVSSIILWQWLYNPSGLGEFGIAGVFFASMVSHLTVVARDMFIPLFLSLTSVYHPIVLGAAAGLGAALGEVSTYFLGWGVAETIREGQNKVEGKLAKWIQSYGLWAVLLVAVTPLPDTPIVLLAGSNRLPFKKLLIVEGIGKTILYSSGAVVGGFVFTGLTDVVGGLTASLLIVAASIIFCVVVTWHKSRNLIFGWVERLLL